MANELPRPTDADIVAIARAEGYQTVEASMFRLVRAAAAWGAAQVPAAVQPEAPSGGVVWLPADEQRLDEAITRRRAAAEGDASRVLPNFTRDGCMGAAESELAHGDIAWPMGGANPAPAAPGPTASSAVPAEPKMIWPKGREAGRMGDMTKLGMSHMRVGLDFDNDVYVAVYNGDQQAVADLEFCNAGGNGGGKSPRTREALIALMVAMEADSAVSPGRAFPPAQEGPIHG